MESEAPDRALNILHIEDSLPDHHLARLTLARSGLRCSFCHVDTLSDMALALRTQRFDLILADYYLPGFTALDAWAEVAQDSDHAPFVLLSGAIGETAAVDAMRLGIADYLLKDDIARLPHVIERAVEVHEARRAHERATAELAASERRLAELTSHLQQSIENERAAIAREIHDDIGGALTAVKFDLSWIDRHAEQHQECAVLRHHVHAAVEMLSHALGASQRIMMDLRPPVLDQGLVAAIRWLAHGFERRTKIPTRVHSSAEAIDVPTDIQLVAYRTAQEALTNISKYAHAQHVHIDLSDREGVLTVEITDDGCGMDPAMRLKEKSFGLKGLHERARTVDGWLDVSSAPGKGTSVIVSVPLPSPSLRPLAPSHDHSRSAL